MAEISGGMAFLQGVLSFCKMFTVSSLIGITSGVFSAVVLKFIDLRKTPSLEVALMLIFSYIPYGLAEGLGLSGRQAIIIIYTIPVSTKTPAMESGSRFHSTSQKIMCCSREQGSCGTVVSFLKCRPHELV